MKQLMIIRLVMDYFIKGRFVMNKLLMDIYFMFKSVVTLLLIALSIWTFWHGCKFQTYGFEIELYGIGRYFSR